MLNDIIQYLHAAMGAFTSLQKHRREPRVLKSVTQGLTASSRRGICFIWFWSLSHGITLIGFRWLSMKNYLSRFTLFAASNVFI